MGILELLGMGILELDAEAEGKYIGFFFRRPICRPDRVRRCAYHADTMDSTPSLYRRNRARIAALIFGWSASQDLPFATTSFLSSVAIMKNPRDPDPGRFDSFNRISRNFSPCDGGDLAPNLDRCWSLKKMSDAYFP